MTEYAYEYDDYDDYEDDDEEEVDEGQYVENWQAEFVNNAQILQNELGRQLTVREVNTVGEMLEEEDYPDVHGAYTQLYEQVEDKEPNLDDADSRQRYIAERLNEVEEPAQ